MMRPPVSAMLPQPSLISTGPGERLEPTCKEMARIAADGLYLVAFTKSGVRVVRVPADATMTVGRSPECEVQLDHSALSRKHFSVHEGRPARVTDLASANGTRASGAQLRAHEPTPIALGHLIEAGGILFMLRDRDPLTEPAGPPRTASELSTQVLLQAVVVEDPAMARLHQLVDMVARSTIPVLVIGETGVGKEIVSTAVHARSLRAQRPLVRIDCAALPETLLEGELFGLERGGFRGASQSKRGLIESADGGSFLLDEIGEMPLTTQAKLLRVLESGEITRLGALKPRTMDVRFIAATNRHLPSLVSDGGFRRDLYYRLAAITIPIPPLRERRVEIVRLAELFLASTSRREQGPPAVLTDETLEILERHSWPGNVRELKNVIERSVTISGGGEIRPEHLLLDPVVLDAPPGRPSDPSPPAVVNRAMAEPRDRLLRMHAEPECKLIVRALEQAAGNQGRAAEALGISGERC
jgi:two-component system, NtrC family, response regulator AtoC